MACRKPRILHIYKDYFPPVRGGIENTINLMARGCSDEFDVSVLVCAGSSIPGETVIDNVRVVRVPEIIRAWSAPFAPAFVSALRREASAADILHFHHPNPTGDVAYLLSRVQKPYVITYHSDVVRQRAAMALYGYIQNRMMQSAQVIMPTSPNYIESSPWLRRYKSRCHVVPLGISLKRFELLPEILDAAKQLRSRYPGPIVTFVGRLRYYKGIHFLIEAMLSVPATLLIIGTGPEMSNLQNLVRTLGLANKVQFLGDVDDENLVRYLYATDVFCLPSHLRSEAFGICQIEAMACGVPVVSTALATGVPFVNVHGETGVIVPPANPRALAEAVSQLLSNDEYRRSLGEKAKKRAHTYFSAERMVSDIKNIYHQVLATSSSE